MQNHKIRGITHNLPNIEGLSLKLIKGLSIEVINKGDTILMSLLNKITIVIILHYAIMKFLLT